MNSATGTLKPKTEIPGRERAIDTVRAGLARRYARERRFRFLGLLAVVTSFVCVGLLFISIIATGYQAIWQTRIRLMVNLDPEVIDPEGKRDPAALSAADYGGLVKGALYRDVPRGHGASRQAGALGSREQWRGLRGPAEGDRGSQAHRHQRSRLGHGQRHRRHVDERPRGTRCRGRGRGAPSQTGRMDRRDDPQGLDRQALQFHLLHGRAIRASRSCRGSGAPRWARSTRSS